MATDRKKLVTNQRYLDKLDRITIRIHKDGSDGFSRDQLEEAAKRSGQSVNAWIVDAIKDKI